MRSLLVSLVCLCLTLWSAEARAATAASDGGTMSSLDDALSTLGLSPLSCTPKKGLLGGEDYFECLKQAGNALEQMLGSTGSLRGCFQATNSPYWKNIDGDRKKTHKAAVKAANKSLKGTSSKSTWEILREVTAGDSHFVNGCDLAKDLPGALG